VERRNFTKKMEQQRIDIIENSRAIIDETQKNLLYDITRSLSWSIRSEITRNNYDQAGQYLNEFVRTREFEVAIFADNEDNIIISTDKRMEQTKLNDHFPGNISTAQEISIQHLPDNKWISIAPVMDLNTRAGTLVIIYSPASVSDQEFLKTQP
jgi:hypothetical protein